MGVLGSMHISGHGHTHNIVYTQKNYCNPRICMQALQGLQGCRVVFCPHTVAVNKKLTLRFSSTAVERCVVLKKTNRKRLHYYSIYGTVRVRNEGHDLLTASENVEALIKTDHDRFLF